MEMFHIRQLAATTHRLKIGIVVDGWRKVALAAIHSIQLRARKADLAQAPASARDSPWPRWRATIPLR
jgi:hypothetical protein